MRYEKRSDMARDRRESHRTRNTMTQLIQKGMKNWKDIEPLYTPE